MAQSKDKVSRQWHKTHEDMEIEAIVSQNTRALQIQIRLGVKSDKDFASHRIWKPKHQFKCETVVLCAVQIAGADNYIM